MFSFLPHSFLQMAAIFLSIVIEAFPFVLLGCIISGTLQVFLTVERVKKLLPTNRFLSVCLGSIIGFFFPSCECGIVPIVNQFMRKGVPAHAAFAFMLTAPIINPIVIFSTYVAFGNSLRFALLRVIGSLCVALLAGNWIAYFYHGPILKEHMVNNFSSQQHCQPVPPADVHVSAKQSPIKQQIWHALIHAVDEFFDTGRYLIFGSLVAAAMQTYLPTAFILQLGQTKFLAVLVMLLMAFILSLCSEADAFIGSSLLSLFGAGPIVAFLVFGPMVDIKNLLMMQNYFHGKFICRLLLLITLIVTVYALIV